MGQVCRSHHSARQIARLGHEFIECVFRVNEKYVLEFTIMVSEQPELRVIREALDAVLAPTIASAIIFDALAANGGVGPENPTSALGFVRGHLRHALERRVGSDADETIENLEQVLTMIAQRPKPREHDQEVTREVITVSHPVVVYVISSEPLLASALQNALGQHQVSALHISELEAVLEDSVLGPPQIVLVDGADFPAIEPEELAARLRSLPGPTVRAIWGADLPYGASVLQTMLRERVPATPIDRREGIEPVVDLIRSRRPV